MSNKRRSFFGWGYEGEAVAAEELAWFERAWAQLFHVDGFDPVPLPRAQEITLQPPRISAPARCRRSARRRSTSACCIAKGAPCTTSHA